VGHGSLVHDGAARGPYLDHDHLRVGDILRSAEGLSLEGKAMILTAMSYGFAAAIGTLTFIVTWAVIGGVLGLLAQLWAERT
jgi:hypothetical protein